MGVRGREKRKEETEGRSRGREGSEEKGEEKMGSERGSEEKGKRGVKGWRERERGQKKCLVEDLLCIHGTALKGLKDGLESNLIIANVRLLHLEDEAIDLQGGHEKRRGMNANTTKDECKYYKDKGRL